MNDSEKNPAGSTMGDQAPWKRITEEVKGGVLYVVATPIGNLADTTIRALHVLAHADLVAAEDTRRTGQLLAHYGIQAKLGSYHEHNAEKVRPVLLDALAKGRSVALVSDAGTPGVSDPGYKLIREAVEQEREVVAIPGASALLAAVVPSGLPLDRFAFEGFLPKKKGRQTRLAELARDPRTLVFFESPERLARTLRDLAEALGPARYAVVGRELTKRHEELVRGTLGELAGTYGERKAKGEITIVVEGRGKRVVREGGEADRASALQEEEEPAPGAQEPAPGAAEEPGRAPGSRQPLETGAETSASGAGGQRAAEGEDARRGAEEAAEPGSRGNRFSLGDLEEYRRGQAADEVPGMKSAGSAASSLGFGGMDKEQILRRKEREEQERRERERKRKYRFSGGDSKKGEDGSE